MHLGAKTPCPINWVKITNMDGFCEFLGANMTHLQFKLNYFREIKIMSFKFEFDIIHYLICLSYLQLVDYVL
jgi:hypothetical protein